MNLLALLGALVLSYYRPHQRSDWLRQLYAPYAQLLQRKCDDGKKVHGIIAWMLGALLPALVIGIAYIAGSLTGDVAEANTRSIENRQKIEALERQNSSIEQGVASLNAKMDILMEERKR